MHIVLLILKILGILLLVLLGLLLLVLLAVLFVPVRYQLQGMWKEDKWASVKVSWLLSVISFKGAYKMEKGLTGSLRVLWFKLWTMGDESAEKIEEAEETAEKTVKKAAEKAVTADYEDKAEKAEAGETAEKVREAENIEKPEKKENLEKGGLVEAAELKSSAPDNEEKTHKSSEDKIQKASDEENTHKSRCGVFLAECIKAMWTRLQAFFQKLKFSFQGFCDKLKDIKAFADKKKEWLEDEENQESFRLLFKQLKKLLAHVWPGRGKGTVTFGLEDPYYTGQILAGASLLYPFFYKRLTLQPVFDEKCLEAELDYRGRVRVSYLLWLFWGIYHHKHTWKMLRDLLGRDNSSDE